MEIWWFFCITTAISPRSSLHSQACKSCLLIFRICCDAIHAFVWRPLRFPMQWMLCYSEYSSAVTANSYGFRVPGCQCIGKTYPLLVTSCCIPISFFDMNPCKYYVKERTSHNFHKGFNCFCSSMQTTTTSQNFHKCFDTLCSAMQTTTSLCVCM